MSQSDAGWQPPPAVVAWLLTVSPRTRLQTILARSRAGGSDRGWPTAIPLSDLQIRATGAYQYQSAIAHPVAAAQGLPVFPVAAAIAQQFTADGGTIPDTIATNLVAQALPTGNLELTLAAVGVAAWWRQCSQGDGPDAISAIALYDCTPPRPGQWPLGDRLQVSLPTLLQWAYSRCRRWSVNQSTTVADATPAAMAPRLDPLTAVLQPVLIQCWDHLAAQPMAPQRWQQSADGLAQAIYQLEAQRSYWQPSITSYPDAIMTVGIAQAFLALLLQVLTGASPAPDL